MSYILDALKRADAERERGAVPGLHARQVSAPALAAAPGPRRKVWLAVAAGLMLIGGVAAGLWKWQAPAGDDRMAAVAPDSASPPVAGPAPPVQPTPVPTPTPEPAAVPRPASPPAAQPSARPPATARPQAAPAAAPAVAPPAPALKPVPVPVPVPKLAPRPAPAASAAAIPSPSLPKPETAASASAPQAAPAAIALLSDLPEAVRRQVPPLNITGSVYSSNPAQRLLLVNNLVLTEGSQVAPGMTLEQIRRKSSVFSFQGNRFQVAH